LQNFSQRHLWQRHAATFFLLRKTLFAATLRFWQRQMSLPKTIFLVVNVIRRYTILKVM
jgi:hypothetical protein